MTNETPANLPEAAPTGDPSRPRELVEALKKNGLRIASAARNAQAALNDNNPGLAHGYLEVIVSASGELEAIEPEVVKSLETSSERDTNADASLLRSIQVWDQMKRPAEPGDNTAKALALIDLRQDLMKIASELGARLGLDCTGVYEGNGFWAHDGDTCPIHEWLVPSDCPEEMRDARG